MLFQIEVTWRPGSSFLEQTKSCNMWKLSLCRLLFGYSLPPVHQNEESRDRCCWKSGRWRRFQAHNTKSSVTHQQTSFDMEPLREPEERPAQACSAIGPLDRHQANWIWLVSDRHESKYQNSESPSPMASTQLFSSYEQKAFRSSATNLNITWTKTACTRVDFYPLIL